MLRRIGRNSDLALFIVLGAGGLWLMMSQNQRLDAAAVATLVGALFGGAAVLLGNWINRYNERRRAATDLEQRRAKLKTLLSAELVNVAAGLIDAKRFVDAAYTSLRSGGPVGERLDMTWIMPRNMPFTDSLGMELLILEQPVIDALVTLRSNLSITRVSMEAITEGRERSGFLRVATLSGELMHDMAVLAKAFELIAPDRKLALQDQPPELATTILNRMAAATDQARAQD